MAIFVQLDSRLNNQSEDGKERFMRLFVDDGTGAWHSDLGTAEMRVDRKAPHTQFDDYSEVFLALHLTLRFLSWIVHAFEMRLVEEVLG